MSNQSVARYRHELAGRVDLIEHDVGNIKSTVSALDGKMDKLTNALTTYVSTPKQSFGQYLQTGAFLVTIIIALTTGITYVAGNSQEQRFGAIEKQMIIKEYESRISRMNLEAEDKLFRLRLEMEKKQ